MLKADSGPFWIELFSLAMKSTCSPSDGSPERIDDVGRRLMRTCKCLDWVLSWFYSCRS